MRKTLGPRTIQQEVPVEIEIKETVIHVRTSIQGAVLIPQRLTGSGDTAPQSMTMKSGELAVGVSKAVRNLGFRPRK